MAFTGTASDIIARPPAGVPTVFSHRSSTAATELSRLDAGAERR